MKTINIGQIIKKSTLDSILNIQLYKLVCTTNYLLIKLLMYYHITQIKTHLIFVRMISKLIQNYMCEHIILIVGKTTIPFLI